jgi:hypothetical protein
MGDTVNTEKLQFKPSFSTCYRPDLNYRNKCKECNFKDFALCKEHPDYKKLKEEWDQKHKKIDSSSTTNLDLASKITKTTKRKRKQL